MKEQVIVNENCSDVLVSAYREFNNILCDVANNISYIQTVESLTSLVEELFPGRIGSFLYANNETLTLHVSEAKTQLPLFYTEAIDGIAMAPDIGSCAAAGYLKELFIVSDTYTHPNWKDFTDLVKKANLRSCWSTPILSKDNDLLGTFAIYSKEISQPNTCELEILGTAAYIVSIALDKKEILKKATTDELTSLNNRHSFLDSLEYIKKLAQRKMELLTVVFIDLNKFKAVNDTFGHEVGNQILIKTAQAISMSLRETDISCRYGGDEFLFALLDCNKQKTEDICLKITNNLMKNIDKNIIDVGFGISFGGTIKKVERDLDLHEMIKISDKEMYLAKRTDSHISIID